MWRRSTWSSTRWSCSTWIHATRSRLARLLGRHSALPVKEAAGSEEIGAVYIAQPDAQLVVCVGRLVLADTALVHVSRPCIDRLFESVAAHPGMPHAARATGSADLVLPLAEVGPAIASLVAGTAEVP